MIAITAYSIPSLFMNGGTGVCTAYLVLVLLNVVFRATGFMSDFDVDAFILSQVVALMLVSCCIFAVVKYCMNRTDRKSIPSIQASAIARAIDSETTSSSIKDEVTNPVQRLFRRHSSISMKRCPYTDSTHVVYECPCCLAKVSDSAWHNCDRYASTGGGAFFTLRQRLGTLMDICEDIDLYNENDDSKSRDALKESILKSMASLQFKKEHFNENNISAIQKYVYWQMQRALMCKSNYLFRALSQSCLPCYCFLLSTEVLNRSLLGFGSMGLMLSFFLLRASEDVRSIQWVLYINGVLSPAFAMNSLMACTQCLYEIYGIGKAFPSLFYDKELARSCERFKYFFYFMGLTQHFR